MRIFAIKDETMPKEQILGYLVYYEKAEAFYIELPEDADPWDIPPILSSFMKRGEHSVNSYWSRLWVEQRIMPHDRQNIGQVIRDNGLETYDVFSLLMLSMGRCAQDDYYLVPISENDLPAECLRRAGRRVEEVIPLYERKLLVAFRDGTVRKCDMTAYFTSHRSFEILLNHPEYMTQVKVQVGGHGIMWDDNLTIPAHELYRMGKKVPLTLEELRQIMAAQVIDASEAAEILNCSRQYVSELVKLGKLHPIKASEKSTLFLRSEVQKRNWK